VAGRARRPGPVAASRRGVRRRGGPLRRRRTHVHGGHRHGRPDAHRVGHRRAAPPPPAPDPAGRRHLVPAVQRTGCGIGPGRAVDPGAARRRRVGGHRPEGVDDRGALLRPGHPAGADRPRRAQAPGDHRDRRRHARSWRRCPSAASDRRHHPLQRGVSRRGSRPCRRHHRPGRLGLGGGADDAHQRAGLDRRRLDVRRRSTGAAGPGVRPARGPADPPAAGRHVHPRRDPAVPRLPGADRGGQRASPRTGELGDEAGGVGPLRGRRRPHARHRGRGGGADGRRRPLRGSIPGPVHGPVGTPHRRRDRPGAGSGCWACPATSGSTRTWRSATCPGPERGRCRARSVVG